MITNNQTVALVKGMSKLARAKFGPGMLLHHDDLEQLNIYTRELSRLMFRSLFGCGVICGLVVTVDTVKLKCGKLYLTIGAGLALDCCGDPVCVPQPQCIVVDENCDPKIPSMLWVVLCGTEKCCAPRTSVCASDEEDAPSVCTRERDGFEIRVVGKRPDCICGCQEPEDREKGQKPDYGEKGVALLLDNECKCVNPDLPCYKDHYDGKCGCNCANCSDCDCECILLARVKKTDDEKHPWTVDHSVRRFIRPVLIRDPQVEIEVARQQKPTTGTYAAESEPQVTGGPSQGKAAAKSPVRTKTSD